VVGGLLTLSLAREADPSVPGGRAYRAIWVEQGRGTEIRKVDGWLVRTDRGWVHADTARTAARLAYDATPAPRPGHCNAGIRDWRLCACDARGACLGSFDKRQNL
jgi:hypothetical protein